MKKILVAAFLALVAFSPHAKAQTPMLGYVTYVTTCGTDSGTAGNTASMKMDLTGKLCTNAASSGGGTSGFNAAFPSNGTAIGCQFSTTLPNFTTTAQMQSCYLKADGSVIIDINPSSTLAGLLSSGTGTIGNALPSTAIQASLNINNKLTTPHICGSYKFVHVTASGNTALVAVSGTTNIYVCDWSYSVATASPTTLISLDSGAGTACATSPAQLTMLWNSAASPSMKGNKTYYTGLNTGASNGLCLNSSVATTLDAEVWYDQY